jgi:polysaccharide export outer membrane protein
VFKPQSPNYFLTGGDLINIEEFFYHQGRAFLVSEDSESIALEVRPEKRPTLADLLFSGDEQIFSQNAARTKEIYMMRGTRPMQVFHLNAQDPSRLRVATEVELRPDDIVFVSRKPIYSVSELINIINPLAVLARSGS